MRDLNFFTPYLGKNKERANTKIYIYGSIIISASLIVGSLAINTGRILLLNRSISSYESKLEVPEIKEKLSEAEVINSKISSLKEYETALTDVSKKAIERDNVSDSLLLDINSTIPSEVSFQNLTITDNVINIKGVSTNRRAVAELKHNLSSLSRMQNVYVNSIDTSGSVLGQYSFEVKCVLKDVD